MTITPRNLDGYGAPTIEWPRVREVLDTQLPQAPGTGGPDRHTTWLTTVSADGSPHVTPVGAAVCEGSWYFTSSPADHRYERIALGGSGLCACGMADRG